MSLYLWLFAGVALCAAFGSNKRFERASYAVSFIALLLFLTLRFGQGTDWLAYNYIYSCAPTAFDFNSYFYTSAVHSEIGWKLLNNAAKCIGLNFFTVAAVISVVEMLLLNRFLSRYSSNRALSLLVAFPVVYFIYFFSALRQGIVIAVFLGLMVPLIERGKTLSYVALTGALATVHSGAIILLLAPMAVKVPVRKAVPVLVASACAGVGFSLVSGSVMLALGVTYTAAGISWAALAYRLIMFSIVHMLYSGADRPEGAVGLLYRVYVAGLCVYLLLASNELISSRLASPLLAVEVALLPALFKGQAKQGAVLVLCVSLLCSVMFVKNMSASIEQGDYANFVTVSNYPYISVFNSEDIYGYSTNRYLVYL